MRLIEIRQRQFDEFAITHKNRNFYQTSQYGEFMSRNGYKDVYVAMVDYDGNLVAASLILIGRVFPNYKMAYAPRGFLIDFYDFDQVGKFTSMIKDYLRKKKVISLKIDPPIEYVERDNEGKPVLNGQNNMNIINYLGSLGYQHNGFNLYFENKLPRWNSVVSNVRKTKSITEIFSPQTRELLEEAERKGVVVFKGKKEDIKTFYSLIKKDKKINYYYKLINIFSNFNMLDIFFTKISVDLFLKNSRSLYEKELIRNAAINNEMQVAENRAEILNKKMESDRLLGIYKNEVSKATNLFDVKKDIILSTSIVIKYGDEIFFLVDGVDEKYKDFYPNHLMTRILIEGFAKAGFNKFHLNGISGDFNPRSNFYNLYSFKKGFGSNVVEYIGEFDLILNRFKYNIYIATHKKKS